MSTVICGSIATDHLMTFEGRFSDSLVPEALAKVSLSFLVADLEIRRGGVGPNICFAMAALGGRPVLVGAAGEDFADYRSWLERHGVDCDSVRVSSEHHTARFVCTTDTEQAQIASFYPGAMSEGREIELGPVQDRVGDLGLVLIGAHDPEGMLRNTQECRDRGIPFVADPSQQLAFADGPFIRQLIEGADYLFTNEYESHLTESKTGWSAEDILGRVGVRVITKGEHGSEIHRRGEPVITVPVAAHVEAVDPTGVGDAFRGGFLTGLERGLGLERCAQLGSALATFVVETVGTQEYVLERERLGQRLKAGYGQRAADEILAALGW